MDRITIHRRVGAIPYRPYGLTSYEIEDIARTSLLFREIEPTPSARRVWGAHDQEEAQRLWAAHTEAVLARHVEAGMQYIYGFTGTIKVDVRYWIRDNVENDNLHGPWSYCYDDGADFVGFSHVMDAMCFRMVVEHYEFLSSIPAGSVNQISSESRPLL